MGGNLLVLREGWEAEFYYTGRGVRRTITTQGGVGGRCNSKHYWLMELLLDRTNNFNLYVKILALGRGVSSFFCHAKAKLPRKHWTLHFADGKYRQATVATIVPLRRFRRFLRKK